MGKALEIDRQLMETRVAAGPSCFARIAKSLIAQGRMEVRARGCLGQQWCGDWVMD